MTSLYDAQWHYDQFAFENALPLPTRIDTWTRPHLNVQIRETEQFLGLYAEDGTPLTTTVWGYGTNASNTSYPGPTIVAYEGKQLNVQWQNFLPTTDHLLPVDTSIHLADPVRRPLEKGYVPVVTHLHGGHTESASDGLPDAWYTQVGGRGGNGPAEVGSGYVKRVYTYDNDQEAAPLWYHDHALGLTRLNVYAGLAGFYLLQDEEKQALQAAGVLPGLDNTVEMAIQDRAFTADGQLYLPAYRDDPLPGTDMTVGDMVPEAFYTANGDDAASIVPEFLGDVILVNGMAWPTHTVALGEAHFTILNGSDSRFYVLEFSDPNVRVTLVGVDGGLLPEAIEIADGNGVHDQTSEFFVIAPGDRVELVVDFSNLIDGSEVLLTNRGPAFEPFKGLVYETGELAGGAEAASLADPVGAIMKFVADAGKPTIDVSVEGGTTLSTSFRDLASLAPDNTRMLGLFEGEDEYGRINPLLGTAGSWEDGYGILHPDTMMPDGTFGPLNFHAPTTEIIQLGDLEHWEIFNFTPDAHPIHLHLVQYQVLEKLAFDFHDEDEDGVPDDTGEDGRIDYGFASRGDVLDDPSFDIIVFDDAPLSVRPEEQGWQDTVWVGPGEMIRIAAEFDRPGPYVWHCHILSHEDHEMMRPFEVVDEFMMI
jgi:spore coat protein A, manganese oxidase